VLARIRTRTAEGRLKRNLAERALLVVLAADADAAVAMAVNLSVVRRFLLELQGMLLPTHDGVLARIRTRTAEGRLKRNLAERALLVMLVVDAAVADFDAAAMAKLAVNLSAVRRFLLEPQGTLLPTHAAPDGKDTPLPKKNSFF
jgi:hypothetical protein